MKKKSVVMANSKKRAGSKKKIGGRPEPIPLVLDLELYRSMPTQLELSAITMALLHLEEISKPQPESLWQIAARIEGLNR